MLADELIEGTPAPPLDGLCRRSKSRIALARAFTRYFDARYFHRQSVFLDIALYLLAIFRSRRQKGLPYHGGN